MEGLETSSEYSYTQPKRPIKNEYPPTKQDKDTIRIGIVGDSQYGSITLRHHFYHMAKLNPQILLHAGDAVHTHQVGVLQFMVIVLVFIQRKIRFDLI